MKVFKLKRPFTNDVKKVASLHQALTVVSDKERQEQLRPTTKIKLSVKGNRRGLNMQENPPSSEEMRRRRAMRRLWNKTMPSLHCSNCQFSSQCPQFKAGYECAFLPFMNAHRIESEEDLIFYAKELAGEGVKRAQIMLLMERLSGAKPDIDTTEALAHVFNQLMVLHQRMTDQEASVEIESSDTTITGKLFGSLESLLGKTRELRAAPLDVPNHASERLLEAPRHEEKRVANEDLLKEFSSVNTSNLTAVPVVAPIQEEL